MSESNRVQLIYVPESTYGTTPTDSANWKTLRYTSENLAAAPSTVISEEIRSDRQVSDQALVAINTGGDVGIELSEDSFDDFLEAALCGTWTTNVLKAGTTERSFTLQKGFLDIATPEYIWFKGCRVGALSLNCPAQQRITGSISFGGASSASTTTSLVGAGSVAAATTTEIMNAGDIDGIEIDGSATSLIVTNVSFSLTNNLRPNMGIGQLTPQDQRYGRSLVTGQLSVYFEDTTLYDYMLANTGTSLQWTINDPGGTKSYEVLLPNIKISGGNPNATGVDTDVMHEMQFTALYDVTEATNIKITRVT